MPKVNHLTELQLRIAEYLFLGKTEQEVVEMIWGVTKDDPHWRRYADKIRRLRKTQKYEEYYNSQVALARRRGYGRALNRLLGMVDDPNPWVALQASNSVLSHTEKAVISEEENTVTVKIEGLPALGTPESEEQDSPQALTDGVQAVLVEAQVV